MGRLCSIKKNIIVMSDFIPVNTPILDGNEKKYLNQCIDTGWISSEGPFVTEFEEKFAKRMGRKHGIAVCNGSAAIDASVEALGISAGDEVIMPTLTIISCVSQIIRSGATPVLVDCDLQTWNMKVHEIEEKITPRTKAIMVVHIFGIPTDLKPVIDIAKKHGLKIIEDAAEVHGQTYQGKPCGSFGDISTFSFYPNKHITTGEGGMILTDDDDLAESCRSLRNLCFQSDNRFVHEKLGWNFRMTNLQAALGLAQLERLDEFVIRKREIGKIYTELLSSVTSLQLPLEKTKYAENIYWVYGVILKDSVNISAKSAMKKLAANGIGTRPFFYPMHLQPVLKNMNLFEGEKHINSEKLYSNGFYLPSGLGLSNDEIVTVVKKLKEILPGA